MTALGLSLMWSALQATLIGMIAVCMGARPWRLGGALTPLLALLAIATITVCNFVPLPGWWPSGPVVQTANRELPAAAVAPQSRPVEATAGVDSQAVAVPAEQAETTILNTNAVLDLAANFVEELKSVRSQTDQRWLQSSIPNWVVGLFAIGIGVGLIRLLLGVYGAAQIVRNSRTIDDPSLAELLDVLQAELGLKTKVRLRQADQLTTAATVGYFAPTILLPALWRTWQPEELRAVLCHELAHIHHRDFGAQLLAQVGVVLHFYNPIVHWLSERMKLEQELAADAVASRLAGGQRQYLRVLATLALDHQNHHVGWPARAFLPDPTLVFEEIGDAKSYESPTGQVEYRWASLCDRHYRPFDARSCYAQTRCQLKTLWLKARWFRWYHRKRPSTKSRLDSRPAMSCGT